MGYRIGICDKDSHYAVGLMEYINMHANIPLKAYAFSSWKATREYIEREELDLIVLGREVAVECCNIPIIYITDNREESCLKNYIYKYQNVELIAKQITKAVRAMGAEDKDDQRILGVYSPIGRSGKTRIAMGMCDFYGNCLYIGWEDFSVYDENVDKQNLAEKILYYILGRNTELVSLIKDQHDENCRFDIIAGGINCMDIRQVSEEDMRWLVNLLKEQTIYKKVVFDIGTGSLGDIKILSVMDKIIVPFLNDQTSVNKLNNFKRFMRENSNSVTDKISTYIIVPDGEYNSKSIKDMIEGGWVGSE